MYKCICIVQTVLFKGQLYIFIIIHHQNNANIMEWAQYFVYSLSHLILTTFGNEEGNIIPRRPPPLTPPHPPPRASNFCSIDEHLCVVGAVLDFTDKARTVMAPLLRD